MAKKVRPGPRNARTTAKRGATRKSRPKGATKAKAASIKPGPNRTAAKNALPAARKGLAPVGSMVLYDLVCPIDGRLASGLRMRACVARAQAHNQASGHAASCEPGGDPGE